MRQNILIIGATGKVGRELLGQIYKNDVPELGIHENPTVVVGLADSRHVAVNTGGFSREHLELFVSTKQKVCDVIGAEAHSEGGVISLPDKMRKLGFDQDIAYVDVTGMQEEGRNLHLKIIGETRAKIVTANKNPVGRYDYDTYKKLTGYPLRYQYSATTMAGLGAVPWLSERHTIQDSIHEINASLSGTVGFITGALTKGERLSDAIRSAREKGYTEPDFRDDLNGVDVARKLTILAREAGFEIDFADIDIEPFLPQEYLQIPDPEECLLKIERELDGVMGDLYGKAANKKATLKYLASLNRTRLKVGLKEVPLDSAFGRLSGTDNRIEVVTDMYSELKPYKLEGPGAGLDITASVVRRDLTRLQSQIKRF